MKRIIYQIGKDIMKSIPYTEDNLSIAEAEAFDQKYSIDDDGLGEADSPTAEQRMDRLEHFVKDFRAQVMAVVKNILSGNS